MILTCLAIIGAATAGGVGAIWAAGGSDDNKDNSNTGGSFETHATSSAEWSVYL